VFNNTFKLPYTFNIHNSTKLITDLNQISITTLINIILYIGHQNGIHGEIIQEMELITKLIIKQNYVELNSKFYQQSEGLAMGAPSSALLSENTYNT
jgi:hypothetical protein